MQNLWRSLIFVYTIKATEIMKVQQLTSAQVIQLLYTTEKPVITGYGIEITPVSYTVQEQEIYTGQDRLEWFQDFSEACTEDEDPTFTFTVVENENEILICGSLEEM